jgi:hypothetical protein
MTSAQRFAPVGSFLNAHCVECHGVKAKKADLALTLYKDEVSILKDRKLFLQAVDMVHEGDMPPKKHPRPSDAEIATFVEAVNAIFDEADKNARPDPGHVTVRRLNKAEYNNTIRDLVGVDFQPAEDFPSDDVGNGFDNIGDVLTISPVLMERYLSAAENVVQAAIVVDPPKTPVRYVGAKYLEPAGRNVPQGRWRPITSGNLNTPHAFSNDGDYVLRVRCYAPKVGGEPAKIALTVDGTEVKTFEVTGEDEKAAKTFEAKFKGEPGNHRFAVALLNPADVAPKATDKPVGAAAAGPKKAKADGLTLEEPKKPAAKPAAKAAGVALTKRTLFVETLMIEGPADTRPASQRKLLAVTAGTTHAQQTREVLTRFANRAYRRPATTPEIDRLVKFVDAAEARGERWEAGVQTAMAAVLCSPKFLFRLELDDRPASDQPRALNDYQLASRLSYFLWASMPDDELFALAAKGQLAADIEPQVKRMLKDPRAKSLVERFAMQWLQLQRLRGVSPDTKMFPNFDERLRSAMTTETEMFIGAIISEDRSVLDLINADFTFVNRPLARHYGIIDTMGNTYATKVKRPGGKPIPDRSNEWVRVSLPPGGARGGILTQASVLTVTSNPTRTSPVKRGKWVLEQILGAPPPPPPPNVPELKTDKQTTGTLRQRMEQHRENPACAACHAKMDPIGFAFENFDAVGAFRDQDGGSTIDPSGTLPGGRSFKGPAELKTILKEKKDQFARCLAEKLTTYALGRGIEYYDRRAIDKICAGLAKDDYRFSRLVIEIVTSDPFRLRRGKEQDTP